VGRGDSSTYVGHITILLLTMDAVFEPCWPCRPNCEVRTVHADGQRRVVLRSTRLLRAGEELSYDYRLSADPDKAIRCRCNSVKCREWL
jgi:SET domain